MLYLGHLYITVSVHSIKKPISSSPFRNNVVYYDDGHYNNVMMSAMASQINSLTVVYSTVYSRRRSKKALKLRVTGLCEGNSLTDEVPAQKSSNGENVSSWWRHHGLSLRILLHWSNPTEIYLIGASELGSRQDVYIKSYHQYLSFVCMFPFNSIAERPISLWSSTVI